LTKLESDVKSTGVSLKYISETRNCGYSASVWWLDCQIKRARRG